jgi:eukaryotic-like serine/threonine-protein kinase
VRSVVRALLATAALLAAATSAQAATSVKQYSPWSADGDPSVRRYLHGSGECTEASRVSSRRDAWRCTSGNVALDPCFQSPTDDEVLCVSDPFAAQGHLLSVVLDTDNRTGKPATRQWALQVGRRRCVVSRSRKRGRRRPSYVCGRRGPYLFGAANRKRSTWTIRYSKSKRGRRAKRVRIRSAWL